MIYWDRNFFLINSVIRLQLLILAEVLRFRTEFPQSLDGDGGGDEDGGFGGTLSVSGEAEMGMRWFA